MCNITDAVLAATLKDLIEVGIVERKSYDEIPPRVEYMLTHLLCLFCRIFANGQVFFIKMMLKMKCCNARDVIITDRGK